MVELKTANVESSEAKDRNLFFENKIGPVWASTKVAAAILGISPKIFELLTQAGKKLEAQFKKAVDL